MNTGILTNISILAVFRQPLLAENRTEGDSLRPPMDTWIPGIHTFCCGIGGWFDGS